MLADKMSGFVLSPLPLKLYSFLLSGSLFLQYCKWKKEKNDVFGVDAGELKDGLKFEPTKLMRQNCVKDLRCLTHAQGHRPLRSQTPQPLPGLQAAEERDTSPV